MRAAGSPLPPQGVSPSVRSGSAAHGFSPPTPSSCLGQGLLRVGPADCRLRLRLWRRSRAHRHVVGDAPDPRGSRGGVCHGPGGAQPVLLPPRPPGRAQALHRLRRTSTPRCGCFLVATLHASILLPAQHSIAGLAGWPRRLAKARGDRGAGGPTNHQAGPLHTDKAVSTCSSHQAQLSGAHPPLFAAGPQPTYICKAVFFPAGT